MGRQSPKLPRAERGYGPEHVALRAEWEPFVDAGEVFCHEVVCVEKDRWIRPGTPWHLAHTADGQDYRGPAHAKCNTAEAGRRGGRIRHGRSVETPPPPQVKWKPTQDW
jgi:hypothetical protein